MPKTPESGNPNSPGNTPAGEDGASSQSSAGKPRAGSAPGDTAPAGRSTPAGRSISERKGQFLIAVRRLDGMQLMGMQPLSFGFIEQTLRASPDIEVVDTVGPKNILAAMADGLGEAPSVLVAKMSEQKATILQQQGQGRLIVERDNHLNLFDTSFQQPPLVAGATPTTGPVLTTVVVVLGKDNLPVKDAEVYLFGSFLPANGVTNEQGQVTLTLFGETAQSIRSLYVKPKADYWSFYQMHPDISIDEANVVGLRPLSDWPSLANFPQQQVMGWGQKAMRLDQLPGNYRGQGVKVAVIDSGAATTHDDLNRIRFGVDIVNKKTDPNTWNVDSIAHGSHCAGVIAGADSTAGVRGFAPEAEVHACKLFPGGQVSQLIDALEYCIEKQIDVVNLSLGGSEPSEALEQQILRAKRLGVACIVAAGNSGGRVQYPASSPNVLAVAAIGKLNEFPPDSYHTQTLTQMMDANGFFSAKFTCFGPEIAVCGPGVAITSSVPPNNFAVWDGTSMATPHITGLAALVLAHHPDFQAMFKTRNSDRVDRLFQIIKLSARYVNLGDPSRSGFGLPDVLVAIGLQPQTGMPAAPAMSAALPMQIGGGMRAAAPLGRAIGGLAGQSFGPSGVNPAAYADLAQQWFGNPWGQVGQALGGQAMGRPGVFEPAHATYMPAFFGQPQLGGGMQGYPFGLPPSAFGSSRMW